MPIIAGRPKAHPTTIKPTAKVPLHRPANAAAQKIREYTIHIRPLARLYAGISAISDAFTSKPAQNHIGFSLCHAYMPSPVKIAPHGIIMISQIKFSIL